MKPNCGLGRLSNNLCNTDQPNSTTMDELHLHRYLCYTGLDWIDPQSIPIHAPVVSNCGVYFTACHK